MRPLSNGMMKITERWQKNATAIQYRIFEIAAEKWNFELHSHVTAFSGHCSVLSVAKICLRDFQARFLFPIELSSSVDFLNTGNAFDSLIFAI